MKNVQVDRDTGTRGLGRDQVLNPLIEMGFIEMTVPGKPTSNKQKYRLIQKRHALIAKLAKQVDVDGK